MVKKTIAVIGKGGIEGQGELYDLAFHIGKLIIDRGYRLMTGGLGGVMEAASRGARSSDNWSDGDIIGILPGTEPADANQFVDIPIPTGIGIGRNMIVTNADGIIAVGGGAGTLSEIAFSWQKMRPIAALEVEGWSGKLAGTSLDGRRDGYDDIIHSASKPEEALDIMDRFLDNDNGM